MVRANPHLLEINARLWINRLRKKYSQNVTFATIPEEELLIIKHLGFDAVWLMGVWQTSPASRKKAREIEGITEAGKKACIDFSMDDIGGSPYAIYDYKLDKNLGGEGEIRTLKERFNALNISFFLDFVANHFSIDSPHLKEDPDCFVLCGPGTAAQNQDLFALLPEMQKFVAYGRDPNFPPWTDTAQLNYFNPKTIDKMLKIMSRISELCDGFRCDMVMLTLPDVYASTWGWVLEKEGSADCGRNLWKEGVDAIKRKNPDFMFLAEVYWGLEWRLQQMGFDYTYDKIIYDRLKFMSPMDIRGHLRAERIYQKRSARFIDNHDEEPSVSSFGREKSQAAAVVIATIKGLRFFYDLQIDGVERKIPIQLERGEFAVNIEVRKFYEKLLKIVDHPAFHGGEWHLVDAYSAFQNDKTYYNILSWRWTQRRTLKIVVVNYSSIVSSALLDVKIRSQNDEIILFEEMSDRFISFKKEDISRGLKVENMQPYSFLIYDFAF